METGFLDDDALPVETYLSVRGGRLYWRALGGGQPIVVLHGGPDFDHYYLRPELDRLAGSFRLVYYDQRGRGRSGNAVDPDEISIESEVADLERVRRHFGFESVAVLGHSWGGVLAMEYAIRHPDRASHLILVNTAASAFASLIPVPGGVGAAEASLTAGLVAMGVDDSTAFAIAFTHRLCTYYLPPIWGYFSMQWLSRGAYI